jgi:adenylate cyclase class IV
MKKIMDNKELTQEQKKIVYEEEVRAWRNGEHVLNTLGFRGWKTFDKYRSKYLTMYQRTLGIKP